MKKEIKKTLIITSIITALPILAGLFLWNQLPDVIATHFGMDGTPNGWSSKWFAVIGLPLILVIVNAICVIGSETDPRRENYPKKMMKIVYWICPVCSWICTGSMYAYELGYRMENMWQWVCVFLGIVFAVIGNYLPKVKQNWYLGIKLPWTYADEDNWNRTHRLSGKVWVIGGILLVLNAFVQMKYLEFVIFAAMLLIPTAFSFLYDRKKRKS